MLKDTDLGVENNFHPGYFLPGRMGHFNDNLRRIQAERRISNKVLAKAVRATPSMISKWRKNVTPEGGRIIEIASALGVTAEDLAGRDLPRHTPARVLDDAEDFDRDITRGYKKHDVPVVGDAEASTNGIIAWSDEGIVKTQVEQWVSRAFSEGDPKAYALRVRGDSMVPRYFPGEIVIAQPRLHPKDGDFACVQLVNGERLIKRVFRSFGGWLLRSMNEAYPTREVTNDEVHAIHVIKHSVARM